MESHPHNHNPETSWGKRLFITMVMNLIIPAVQIIVGIMAGSMALISDALHNLSDFASILISYLALKVGKRGPYPFSELSATGAWRSWPLSSMWPSFLGPGLYIAVEGWIRLKNPTVIQGNLVIWAALLGIVANGISTWMLHAGAKENLNMRGAFLHMLTDTLTSLGVALLGVLWLFRPWYWLDPIVSWAIVVLILYSGWGILKEALLILMNAVPAGIDLETIQKEVESLEGVEGLHHLHVWNPLPGRLPWPLMSSCRIRCWERVDDLAQKVRALAPFQIQH